MIITYIILFILFKNIYSLYSIHQLYKITTLDDVIIYPKFNNINNNIKSLLTNCNKYEIIYSNYNSRLFEISHNYKIYNYKPYAGSEYVFDMSDGTRSEYQINNCKGMFVYRTKNNLYKNELSDQIMIKINDNIILYISIINDNNIFVSNNFVLDTHNWMLTNNHNYNLTYFQQQIIGSDHLINLDLTKKYDKSLWYFSLISLISNNSYFSNNNNNNSFFKYNLGVCFKSYLIFTLNIFAYENKKIHNIHNIKFIKIQSIIEIYYPLIDFDITKNTHTIKIKLSPELWFNSVDNSILSDDDFIFVLSNLYKIEILGDLCLGSETVGLSNIMIKLD